MSNLLASLSGKRIVFPEAFWKFVIWYVIIETIVQNFFLLMFPNIILIERAAHYKKILLKWGSSETSRCCFWLVSSERKRYCFGFDVNYLHSMFYYPNRRTLVTTMSTRCTVGKKNSFSMFFKYRKDISSATPKNIEIFWRLQCF